MNPRVLVSGGTSGIGLDVVQFFAPNSLGLSRRTGHDIGQKEQRQALLQLSLEYDVFFNHAHNGHFEGQVQLLYEIFDLWKTKGKNGYILSTSSFTTYDPQLHFQRYAVLKRSLEIANQQCCKAIENEALPFRMTCLKPGMLDTLRSREKSHWNGYGVRGKDVAELILRLYQTPKDLLFNEVTLSAMRPHVSAQP